jgi:TPR repeat protein
MLNRFLPDRGLVSGVNLIGDKRLGFTGGSGRSHRPDRVPRDLKLARQWFEKAAAGQSRDEAEFAGDAQVMGGRSCDMDSHVAQL